MTDSESDLRATETSIRRDADHLAALEEEKASLAPGNPRVDRLSEQVSQVADDLRGKAAAERELAEQIGSDGDAGRG